MMSLLVGFLTVVLVIDCLLLVFLVLLQLPKKEAGAGMAFGGAATDALFGAGSGNVLTKITTYVAGAFFVLTLGLSVISSNANKSAGASGLTKALTEKSASVPAAIPTTAPAPSAAPSPNLIQPIVASNAPAAKPLTAPLLTAPPATNK